jgi:hypothetical protein
MSDPSRTHNCTVQARSRLHSELAALPLSTPTSAVNLPLITIAHRAQQPRRFPQPPLQAVIKTKLRASPNVHFRVVENPVGN